MAHSNTQQLNDQDLDQMSGGAFLGITPEMLQHNRQLPRPLRPGENYNEIFKRIPR